MDVVKCLEGHKRGVLSVSRTILVAWFSYVILFSCVASWATFFGEGLPENIDQLFNFITLSSGIFAGNYVGREGVKTIKTRKHKFEESQESIEYD